MLETNLYQHLKSKGFQPLPLNIIKLYAQHILQGMQFYERLNIIHCDLKPENIMLNSDFTKAIIIDFGSACFTNKRVFTYIQSRYYRAPEVILEIGYDFKIDMWSLGCVLGELATGRPIFAGKNEIDQFLAIVEVLGLPPSIMLESSPKCEAIVEQFKKISGTGHSLKTRVPASRSLKTLVPNNDALFLDFLTSKDYLGCLCWNPGERISPSQALDHDWFKTSGLTRQGSLPDLKWEKLLTPGIKLSSTKSKKIELSARSVKTRPVVNRNKND
jgi:serine/threonine protein kinase